MTEIKVGTELVSKSKYGGVKNRVSEKVETSGEARFRMGDIWYTEEYLRESYDIVLDSKKKVGPPEYEARDGIHTFKLVGETIAVEPYLDGLEENKLELCQDKWTFADFLLANGYKVRRYNGDGGRHTCAFCAAYVDDECHGCPIFEKTGERLCKYTPYIDFIDSRSAEEQGRYAKLELEFLMSLEERPKVSLEEAYLVMQRACGFEEGDRVRILRRAYDRELGWRDVWLSEMDFSVGESGVVEGEPGDMGIAVRVSGCRCNYPWFVLEKV